jgi:gamma-polyglutamate synthase
VTPSGWLVGSVVGVVVLLLAVEAIWIRRLRRCLPLRMAVTGTRGKSSVVRLIAAGLSAAGHRVTYKTTGSQAVIGAPEEEEARIPRRGIPTPLEQRTLLRHAVRSNSTALVVEAMSIRPESLRAELQRIIDPHVLVVTNIRVDHTADLVNPDHAFADAAPRHATVIYPKDISTRFQQRLAQIHEKVSVCVTVGDEAWLVPDTTDYAEWSDNVALAVAACEQAGVSREMARFGMSRARPDIGAFATWRWPTERGDLMLVNAFAANDPTSTQRLLHVAKTTWGSGLCIGLLNLRRDRGDRTEQWIRFLHDDVSAFDRLLIMGDVPAFSMRPVRRSYKERLHFLRTRDPAAIMAAIQADAPAGSMVFGFGNIGGVGLRLVEFWQGGGRPS